MPVGDASGMPGCDATGGDAIGMPWQCSRHAVAMHASTSQRCHLLDHANLRVGCMQPLLLSELLSQLAPTCHVSRVELFPSRRSMHTSIHTCMHLYAHLYSPLFTLVLTSMHTYTQHCSHLYSPLFTPGLITKHTCIHRYSHLYSPLFTPVLITMHTCMHRYSHLYSPLFTPVCRGEVHSLGAREAPAAAAAPRV